MARLKFIIEVNDERNDTWKLVPIPSPCMWRNTGASALESLKLCANTAGLHVRDSGLKRTAFCRSLYRNSQFSWCKNNLNFAGVPNEFVSLTHSYVSLHIDLKGFIMTFNSKKPHRESLPRQQRHWRIPMPLPWLRVWLVPHCLRYKVRIRQEKRWRQRHRMCFKAVSTATIPKL